MSSHWRLILVVYFTLFCVGLLDNTRGPFLSEVVSDLKLSGQQAAFYFIVVSSIAALCGPLVRLLAKHMALIYIHRCGQLFLCFGFLSMSQMYNFASMIFACVVFGFGYGLVNVVQNVLITESLAVHLKRQVLSGLHAMYAIASFVSPALAALVFSFGLNWRSAFVGFSFVPLISLILSFLLKERVRYHADKSLGHFKKTRQYWMLATALSLYIVAEILITTRLSYYAHETLMMSESDSALVLAGFFFFMVIGRLTFLFTKKEYHSLRVICFAVGSSFLFYVFGLFVHVGFLIFSGLTMAPVFALSIDVLSDTFKKQSVEAITSVITLNCLYIIAMNYIVGLLTDVYSISMAMNFGALTLVLSFIIFATLHCQKCAPSSSAS